MHQQRLLLVDGDLIRAERMAKRLAHLELDIQIAGDGATGLLQAHESKPDVIVAGSNAPILNGYLMLQALREDPATCGVPVILLTEGSGPEELARGWKAGADLCVPWTQGEADVLATLHRALSNIQAGRRPEGTLALTS